MKTARELFEELGWEQKVTDAGKYWENIEYGKNYDQGACRGKAITFYKESKCFQCDCQDRHYDMDIDIKLYRAITQQMKELGWIE